MYNIENLRNFSREWEKWKLERSGREHCIEKRLKLAFNPQKETNIKNSESVRLHRILSICFCFFLQFFFSLSCARCTKTKWAFYLRIAERFNANCEIERERVSIDDHFWFLKQTHPFIHSFISFHFISLIVFFSRARARYAVRSFFFCSTTIENSWKSVICRWHVGGRDNANKSNYLIFIATNWQRRLNTHPHWFKLNLLACLCSLATFVVVFFLFYQTTYITLNDRLTILLASQSVDVEIVSLEFVN